MTQEHDDVSGPVSSEGPETLLTGGIANAGRVVRIGDTVRRPRKPQNEAVHAFLRHLRAEGVVEAPEPLGFDGHNREVLVWIDGAAPEHPLPQAIATDGLLEQVATLQRRMHLAASTFEPPLDAPWNALGSYFPEGSAGNLVCHNDLSISNLILEDTTGPELSVVGVIDFDYTHPTNRLFDLAVAFRHWAPLISSEDQDTAWHSVGAPRQRLALFSEVHELDATATESMLELCIAFLRQARLNVRGLADGGHAGFKALIDSGYEQTNDRSVALTVSLLQSVH